VQQFATNPFVKNFSLGYRERGKEK